MDNFSIKIVSEGQVNLTYALTIAFNHAAGRKAVGYRVSSEKGLIFYWSPSSKTDYVPLPFKLDAEGAVDFVQRWLAEQPYGTQPDHDGDNGKGWYVYNESWGVDNEWAAFVAIKPAWACYGK